MTTLNVNVTEMVNNSVESNNATMGNIEELTKVLKQEEKLSLIHISEPTRRS